jgi:hypothetical protein
MKIMDSRKPKWRIMEEFFIPVGAVLRHRIRERLPFIINLYLLGLLHHIIIITHILWAFKCLVESFFTIIVCFAA